jgi:hypothetical protein
MIDIKNKQPSYSPKRAAMTTGIIYRPDRLLMEIFNYSDAVRFTSSVNKELAIARLRRIVHRDNPLSTLTAYVPQKTLFGSVGHDAIVLHCMRPFTYSLFAPRFYGRFVTQNENVMLEGMFTVSRAAKASFFAFLIICTMAELMSILGTPDPNFLGNLPIPPT